tara:strand:+ start:65 stop:814 length:750 start_codon:yes stop_codon:yes gene_type:complete
MKNYKEIFKDKGYFILKKIFDENTIKKVCTEIVDLNDAIKYFDRKGYPRRIEKFYDKNSTFKNLNKKLLEELEKIFGEKFTIFKDKYNSKPPGGEGYYSHYDGIFKWKDKNLNERKGWYDYTDYFINALIALDPNTSENGRFEIAKMHNDNFEELLKNTKQDGTPHLLPEIENKCEFEKFDLDPGDLIVFSHKCPHRSSSNKSKNSRRIVIFTYTRESDGSFYDKYYEDKNSSKNKDKSLIGEFQPESK